MGVTVTAANLRANHAVTAVGAQLDVLRDRGLGEARPARARLELGVRAEEMVAAGGAAVGPISLGERVLPGEWGLGATAAQYLVLLRRKLLAPLLLGLGALRVDVGLGVHGFAPCGNHVWFSTFSAMSQRTPRDRSSRNNAGGTPRRCRTLRQARSRSRSACAARPARGHARHSRRLPARASERRSRSGTGCRCRSPGGCASLGCGSARS